MGIVSSLFDLFGNGRLDGLGTRGSCVYGQMATYFELPSTFFTRVVGGVSSTTTTTTTTYRPYVTL